MDKPVDVIFGNGLGDALAPIDVNVHVGKVPGRTDQKSTLIVSYRSLSLTWSDIGVQQGYRQHQSDGRSLRSTGYSAGRIPESQLD